MSVLDSMRSSVKDIKVSVVKYLTPLEYMEFTVKMLMVFEVAKVELCLWISTFMLLCILIVNSVFSMFISQKSVLVALLFSIVFNVLFVRFRKKNGKTSDINYEIKSVKIKEEYKDEPLHIPDSLKKYVEVNKK